MAENNMPISSKRFLSMVQIIYHMLRKGISKNNKLHADIDLLMKRGKAIIHSFVLPHLISTFSLIFHHKSHGNHMSPPAGEYEFSCSNTPAYYFPIFHSKRSKASSLFLGCTHAPRTNDDEEREATIDAVNMVIEMLNNHTDEKLERKVVQVQPSPALPGFGRSPALPVRQIRVTDSPFPLQDVGGDRLVDEKADKFIAKFYSDLKRQRVVLATPSPGRPWW